MDNNEPDTAIYITVVIVIIVFLLVVIALLIGPRMGVPYNGNIIKNL